MALDRAAAGLLRARTSLCRQRSRGRSTETQLADRLHSKQPHIARLEQGDASLELMMRALLVMGESTKKIARVLAA